MDTKWEFALSCLAVALAAITYHGMRYMLFVVEDAMNPVSPRSIPSPSFHHHIIDSYPNGYQEILHNNSNDQFHESKKSGEDEEKEPIFQRSPHGNSTETNRNRNYSGAEKDRNTNNGLAGQTKKSSFFSEDFLNFLLRLLHSLVSALSYGLALMLMLVAMTYNPSLFLSLVVGYGLGDFLFFTLIRDRMNFVECHWILHFFLCKEFACLFKLHCFWLSQINNFFTMNKVMHSFL